MLKALPLVEARPIGEVFRNRMGGHSRQFVSLRSRQAFCKRISSPSSGANAAASLLQSVGNP
jgi:hypothetical protein